MKEKTDYNKTSVAVRNFLDQFTVKVAATSGDEIKAQEGAAQTDEVKKGDGTSQGKPGSEMSTEVTANLPAGTSISGGKTNQEVTDAEAMIKKNLPAGTANTTAPKVIVSPDPSKDNEVNGTDESIKKAYAQNILLGSRILGVVERRFKAADAAQAAQTPEALAKKQAADEQAMFNDIVNAACEQKEIHVREVMKAFGVSAKAANDIMNEVASEDPTAVLPPDTMPPEQAESILAGAGGAPDPTAARAVADDAGNASDAGAATGGGDLDPAMVQELQSKIEELKSEGFSEEEIAEAFLKDAGMSGDDLVNMLVEEFKSKGLSHEEAQQLVQELQSLQEQGVTPEQLQEVLGQGGDPDADGDAGADESAAAEAQKPPQQ